MKYKMALQGNMKWYVFAIFLLSFCLLFMRGAKAHAYTIEGHYDDKATIWIDKAEISDDDMDNLGARLSDVKLSKDQINSMLKEQVVGKYYDANIYDDNYTYHKDACDEGQNLTAGHNEDKQKNGELYFPGHELRIKTTTNTSAGECFYVFPDSPNGQGYSVTIKDTNKSNIWFRRKDANVLVRVDGRGGDFSNKDTGNPNVYQSTKQEEGADGRCAGNGYPNITIDDGTKTSPIANGQYESCDNSPGLIAGGRDKGRGRFGVNIDNRGPGGSGGEVVGTIPATDGGAAAGPSCQSINPLDLNWWICGFIQALDGMALKATEMIDQLLTLNPQDFNNTTTQGQQLYKVWSMFRALSSFALIAIMLVMVIGQALGGD